jgi:CelD/BcsL family acetyltransferase involved in cellulose biosynthesis
LLSWLRTTPGETMLRSGRSRRGITPAAPGGALATFEELYHVTLTATRSAATARVPLTRALDVGQEAWDQLLRRSGVTNPFLTWAWHRACALAVSPEGGDGREAIMLHGATGDLEAVFPFRVNGDRVANIPVHGVGWAFGDLGCPDHLDLLASPDADLETLVRALADIPWQVIRLANVAEGAGNVERFRAACERRGWMTRRRLLGRCPYLELPGSWDAYLSGLSAHGRHAIRRKERKLREQHRVVLTDYLPERLEEGWQHLQRLHTLRWAGGGAFRDPTWERLHRRFAASLAEAGQLWLLTLDLDSAPAAVWYGFALGETLYHYQSGRDPRWEHERVGTVLMSLIIRRGIERGYRRLDFLRGEEAYKTEWTRTAQPCYEVLVFRAGWRGEALRGLDWVARRVRSSGSHLVPNRFRRWLAEAR